MKILDKEKEPEYCDFMDKIAITICKESFKGIRDMHDQNVNPTINSEELAMAMGQVVLDQVIEQTKDMSREDLLKIFSEVSIAHVVSAMQDNQGYKLKILLLSGVL
jgi:hypothetical protein